MKNMWESRFENLRTLFHLRFAEPSLDLGLCHTKTKRTLLAGVLRLRPGIRLWRRYARLPLTSELDALCAAYVNRTPLRQGARNRFKSKAYTAKRKNRGHHTGVLYFLEVQAGFEPADNGVADRGLTTWLLHQIFSYCNIITKFFYFVKGERSFLQKRFQKIQRFQKDLKKDRTGNKCA